jgi:hypothetical protein
MKSLFSLAALHACGTTAYITLVAIGFFYAPDFFGRTEKDTVFIPIIMLSVFVVSATITGLLVLGRPALWYLDGKKKEALILLGATLGFLLLTIMIWLGVFLVWRHG